MFPNLQWFRLHYPSQTLHTLAPGIVADYDRALRMLYYAGFKTVIGPESPRYWTVFNRSPLPKPE